MRPEKKFWWGLVGMLIVALVFSGCLVLLSLSYEGGTNGKMQSRGENTVFLWGNALDEKISNGTLPINTSGSRVTFYLYIGNNDGEQRTLSPRWGNVVIQNNALSSIFLALPKVFFLKKYQIELSDLEKTQKNGNSYLTGRIRINGISHPFSSKAVFFETKHANEIFIPLRFDGEMFELDIKDSRILSEYLLKIRISY